AIISASAIGWYGSAERLSSKEGFSESEIADNGFLGETCRLWEESIEPARQLGKRLVCIRTGIVLSNTGGTLNEFKKPLRFGIAAILGSGRQMISWIHIEDLCRIYSNAIEKEQLNGSYNAVSPMPVTSKALTLEFAERLKGRFFIPIHIPA